MTRPEGIIELLQSISLFRNVNPKLLDGMVEALEEQVFPEKHVLFRQGDAGDRIYLLVQGKVKIDVDGVEISHQGPGSYFGEMALFEDKPRSATVTTLEPSRCFTLGWERLSSVFTKAPRIAMNMLRVLSERMRNLCQMIVAVKLPFDDEETPPLEGSSAREILRSLPLFRRINDDKFLGRVASVMKETSFAAGETICARGEPGDKAYILTAGQVRVHLDDLELLRLQAGNHFGELSLLDAQPRSASVTALGDVRCLTLTQQQLSAAIAQSPDMAVNMIRELSRRVRKLMDELGGLEDGELPEGETASRPQVLPYLELPAGFAWVKDEATNTWRIPVTTPLTEEFDNAVAPSEPAAEEPVEDFLRALSAERKALGDALSAQLAEAPAREALLQKLAGFVEELYGQLRTPIFPKKAYQSLATSMARHAMQSQDPVCLRAVLASPTAVAEIGSFLRCAGIFRRHWANVDLEFLLVRWENLIEARAMTLMQRDRFFDDQVAEVERIVRGQGWEHARVTVVNVQVDVATGEVLGPEDFQRSFTEVRHAMHDLRAADSRLAADLLWARSFYARQASLSRLGEEQVLVDLTLRRGIGARFSAEIPPIDGKKDRLCAMLTSELNKRFLACYNASLPMVNIVLDKP